MKGMKSWFLMGIMGLTGFATDGQAADTNKLEYYGFVRSDFYADSHNMFASVQDLFGFYPLESEYSIPKAGLSSITTRLGLTLHAGGIWGANKSRSVFETDFGGSPTYMLLRIRQAYSQLIWEHSDLLIGQTWHPLFTGVVCPNVLSLNTGNPFQTFNRSPQVLYQHHAQAWTFQAAAIYQMMYTSTGPLGRTADYQKYAVIPEIYLGAQWQGENHTYGVGVDYKSIAPHNTIPSIGGGTERQKERLNTPAIVGYYRFLSDDRNWTVKAKGLYGQNLTEQSIIGGYAVTPDYSYIAYNSLASFVHINYGKTHQAGLLIGYSANLGPQSDLPAESLFYGFGVSGENSAQERLVSDLFRLSPTYSYNLPNWRIGVELEYTRASWGNRNTTGQIDADATADNYRLYGIFTYLF